MGWLLPAPGFAACLPQYCLSCMPCYACMPVFLVLQYLLEPPCSRASLTKPNPNSPMSCYLMSPLFFLFPFFALFGAPSQASRLVVAPKGEARKGSPPPPIDPTFKPTVSTKKDASGKEVAVLGLPWPLHTGELQQVGICVLGQAASTSRCDTARSQSNMQSNMEKVLPHTHLPS